MCRYKLKIPLKILNLFQSFVHLAVPIVRSLQWVRYHYAGLFSTVISSTIAMAKKYGIHVHFKRLQRQVRIDHTAVIIALVHSPVDSFLSIVRLHIKIVLCAFADIVVSCSIL